MRSLRLLFVFLLAMRAIPLIAQTTAAPTLINYQGRLATPDGNPIPNGSYSIRLSVWSAAAAGTERWSRTLNPVAVRNGTFAVLLDFTASFTAGNDIRTTFNSNAYLEIQVGADTPFAPRQQIVSVPYALRANTVPDGAIGTAQLANGAITTDKLGFAFPNSLDSLGIGMGFVGSVSSLTDPMAVGINGNFAFVVNSASVTLRAFNVANPGNIVQVGAATTGVGPRSIAIANNRAYVVNQTADTFQIFNITNPAAIILESTTATADQPLDIAIVGTTAYIVNFGTSNLQIFNVANPAAPVLQGTIGTTANPTAVAASGTTAFVVTQGGDDLQSFNVANPAAPVLLSTFDVGFDPQDIIVSGGTAYIATAGFSRIEILNVSAPAAPVLLSATFTGGNPMRLALGAGILYMTDNVQNAVLLYNVVAPSAPVLIGKMFAGSSPTGIALSSNSVFVTDLSADALYVYTDNNGIQINNSLTVENTLGVFGDAFFGADLSVFGTTYLNGALNVVGLTNLDATEIRSDAAVTTTIGTSAFRILNSAGTTGLHFDIDEIQRLGGGSLFINFANLAATRINNFAYFTTDQRLGIGDSVPDFRLELPNTATDAGGRGRANAWVTYSSGRWKHNVAPIENALDKVLRLNGVMFDWLPEYGGTRDIGFVAEEAGRVVPELVSWEKDGVFASGMKYDRVTALLVEAVKQQQKQIESLQTVRVENAELKKRLDELTRLVKRLLAKPTLSK